VTELSRSINTNRIVVGEPLPFSIYDGDRKLLLSEGRVVATDSIRERLIRVGVYWSSAMAGSGPHVSEPPLEDEEEIDPLVVLNKEYADLLRRARLAVKIAPNETAEGYLCWVVGVSHRNRCLMLTAPARADKSLVSVLKGQKWYCRLFNATTVFRFYGTVVKTAFEPFPYLHLALPAAVERRTVRSHPRALVNLPGMLVLANQEQRAIVVDISVSGARIGVERRFKLTLGDTMTLRVSVSLLDQQLKLDLPVSVVVTYGEVDPHHPEVAFYGVRFESLTEHLRLTLHAFVQEQLATELDTLGQVLAHDDLAPSAV
jgi:hypothetical protein